MNKFAILGSVVLCAASTVGPIAGASPVGVDVDGYDAIYNADAAGVYSPGNPQAITLPTGAVSFTFAGSAVVLSLNFGSNINDPDGVGAAVATSSNTGTSTLSGIVAPNAGYLVGVFLGPTSGAAAPTTVYASTSFTSYAPLLQQVFFVGDGLTGDGTGTSQTFYVPTGATTLYFGFADASGYNGSPGSYGDNQGYISGAVDFALATVVTPPPPPPTPGNTVPEPLEATLLGLGLLAAGLVRRRN